MRRRRKQRITAHWVLFALVLVLVAFVVAAFWRPSRARQPDLGVTFSKVYADQLGIDWREAYEAVLIDLDVGHIRIPVYWSDLEREQDVFRFDAYDYMLDRAQEEGVDVTLAIGRKVPRWPECFVPEWAEGDVVAQNQHVLDMLHTVVTRYRSHESIVRWQVENEPFLIFGECPEVDVAFLERELELVRALDSRPIVMTASGELEPWLHVIPFADELGFSLYRLTWNEVFGFFIYPYQPVVYRSRVMGVRPFVDRVYVSELQAEPWLHQPMESLTPEQQVQMFSPRMLEANVRFARRIPVDQVDLWGVEWWYAMKLAGQDALWETARELFSKSL